MNYQQRLDEIEAKVEDFEQLHKQLQQEMELVLADRPCDFYLEYKGQRWTQCVNIKGERSGLSWTTLRPEDKAVYKTRRFKTIREYADYLGDYLKITGIEIKELPRV